jgi:hypothetical protein
MASFAKNKKTQKTRCSIRTWLVFGGRRAKFGLKTNSGANEGILIYNNSIAKSSSPSNRWKKKRCFWSIARLLLTFALQRTNS